MNEVAMTCLDMMLIVTARWAVPAVRRVSRGWLTAAPRRFAPSQWVFEKSAPRRWPPRVSTEEGRTPRLRRRRRPRRGGSFWRLFEAGPAGPAASRIPWHADAAGVPPPLAMAPSAPVPALSPVTLGYSW